MRLHTKLRCAVASAAMLAVSPAAAQTVDRIVAFGDSYADDGNLFEFGVPRQAIYPNGRFSNGTNFVDTMAAILGVPVDNFAIGGAFTGTGNINPVGPLGFQLEYQSFLAGGGPPPFPRVSGTFDANDLLVVSIGGNDARAFRIGGGTVAAAPTAAAISVGEATIGLNALVNAGARNITYLAGDVGSLPEAVGTPSAAAGTAFSTAFNTGMQATLAGYAEQGVVVNYIDGPSLFRVVEANLGAFGLQSAGACPVACVTTNPELLDRYLFYVDRVHLTLAGFAIVGQYAVRQLEAPLTFAGQSDVGLSAASGFGQLMSGRLDLANSGGAPLSVFVVGTTDRHDARGSYASYAHDYDSFGFAGGAEFGFGPASAGVVASYSRPRADSVAGRTRADAWHLGAYAHLEFAGAFVEGYAGYGWLDYEMRRRAVINDITAEADGNGLVAGGEAGFLFGIGGLRAGPVVGLQYARAELGGYTEAGDPVLALSIGEQRASETIGFAGIEVNLGAGLGGVAVAPFVKLLAEKELDASNRTLLYANTASPGIVNRYNRVESDDDVYARLEGGVSLNLGPAVALQVQASAVFEHPEYDDAFSGQLGLKVGF